MGLSNLTKSTPVSEGGEELEVDSCVLEWTLGEEDSKMEETLDTAAHGW